MSTTLLSFRAKGALRAPVVDESRFPNLHQQRGVTILIRFRPAFGISRSYFVYIMTNKSRTLYTGVTNSLERRVYEHKHKMLEGFTKHYNINQLVYFEEYGDIREAIAREKQFKNWRREKKIALIESLNPTWQDLSADWEGVPPN